MGKLDPYLEQIFAPAAEARQKCFYRQNRRRHRRRDARRAFQRVWYGAVLRGDINRIVVGHHSNVQDNAVLHLAREFACVLGNWVTVGHSAIIHACTVGDEVLVGMGAVIMDWLGHWQTVHHRRGGAGDARDPKFRPARWWSARRPEWHASFSKKERAGLKWWAQNYVDTGGYCLKHGIRGGRAGANLIFARAAK